tara:strand:- start:1570 stop:2052 length:483 start_codon:yes stop_codon:yes gene_type:complete
MATNGRRKNTTELEVRRYQLLELRLAGATYRQIGERMGISKSVAHREVRRALSEMAEEYSEEADKLRAVQMSRYNKLLIKFYPEAIAGESVTSRNTEALHSVLSIMGHINKINGLEQKNLDIDQKITEFTFNIERANLDDDLNNPLQPAIPISQTETGDI